MKCTINLDKIIENKRAFVFDLDDTLYPEVDYLMFAYKEIALFVFGKYNISVEDSSNFLLNTFQTSGRDCIFDALIEKYELIETDISDLLSILRNVNIEPSIQLFPGVADMISKLILMNKQIYILTNGNLTQQQNKIKSIDWKGVLPHIKIYYAYAFEPKPSPAGLNAIITENSLGLAETLMIGDADTDRLCANEAGIDFYFADFFLKEFNFCL